MPDIAVTSWFVGAKKAESPHDGGLPRIRLTYQNRHLAEFDPQLFMVLKVLESNFADHGPTRPLLQNALYVIGHPFARTVSHDSAAASISYSG